MMERFDSGYTEEEIEAIVCELLDDAMRADYGLEAGMVLALCLGLGEGDIIEISERNTVILPTPRAAIDRRLSRVRALVAGGMPLSDALDAARDTEKR